MLARLVEAPDRAAILLDVDGVLAPIVEVPHEAVVPEETRAEVARLHERYALVACISGRSGAERGASSGSTSSSTSASTASSSCPKRPTGASGCTRSPRRSTGTTSSASRSRSRSTTGAPRDEADALAMLEAVAARARHEGFVARFGRKVLELRPPIGAHKGTAVAHLLGERGLERALYAGDDTTDLDAFDAVQGLELGVRVAVASPEGPAELREAADIVVDGPRAMLQLLRQL